MPRIQRESHAMPIHPRRSLTSVVSVAALIAAVTVSPAVAGGTTHVVGKGGGAGVCGAPDHATIGAAVTAANAGDTILVCPGRYREQVTITGSGKDGLTIRGVAPWQARLEPPLATTTAGTSTLMAIDGADRVTVQWLRFQAPTAQPCLRVGTFIAVRNGAQGARIRANRFRALGAASLGPCGYSTAVQVSAGTSAWVGYNLIQDFAGLGVLAAGRTTITRSSFRYWHRGEAETARGGFAAILGSGGPIRVIDNRIVGLDSAGSSTPTLSIGVSFDGGETNGLIRENLVRNVGTGLRLFEALNAGSGVVRILDNEVHGNRGDGMRIASKGFTGSRIEGNDFRGNAGLDCSDGSGGIVATWTDNLGDDADVAGICTPGVVAP